MKVLDSIARRCFRGRAFTRLLEGCGIEPRRYWLLVDLFQTLGNRGEVARMGNQDYSMRFLVILWFFMASLISLVMAVAGASPGYYLLVFLGLTVFQLSILLIPEAAENLVNPVEGLILAHQPVNGATWSGAKLSHLIKAVVYVVAGINGVPALVGLSLPHGDRFHGMVYPLAHLLIALGVGMVAALLCCSLFGWLIRFIPVRRLKAAAGMAQVVPMLFLFGFQVLTRSWRDLVDRAGSVELPQGWLAAADALPGGFPALLGVVGGAVGLVVIFQGLRALSADHLIRVSGLMHSGSRIRRLKRRGSQVGPWVARFAGGQASRAGFEYLRCMMLRDWQFLRNAAPIIPMVILPFGFLLAAGGLSSPLRAGLCSHPPSAPPARTGDYPDLQISGLWQRLQGHRLVFHCSRFLLPPLCGRNPCGALAPAGGRSQPPLAAGADLVLGGAGGRPLHRLQHGGGFSLPGGGTETDRRCAVRKTGTANP